VGLVDDGSQDHSTEVIAGLCAQDVRVRGLTQTRNFGFQVAVTAGLQPLVARGQLRYVYRDARAGGGQGFGQGNGSQSDISSWVSTQCTAVQGFNTATRNQGAPGGTGGTGGNGQNGGGFSGQMQVTLYDCAAAG
jgi:glycosyltransferase involved in cell wall biosynthesis